MSPIRTLVSERETRIGLAVWAVIPAVFLFFAVTLAVNPSANLERLELGAAVLDAGVETPAGPMNVGPSLVDGLRRELGADVRAYASEAELADAVLAREIAAGIVVPAGTTERLVAGQPVELGVVRSDANDPFTNAFTAGLASQMAANLNAALPAMLPGGGASPPATVSVAADTVATSTDFRLATVMAGLLLPLWVASLAFGALVSRAGDRVRRAAGAIRAGVAELAVAAGGAGIVAAVLVVGLATFTWRGDLDLVGLFAFLWLGLAAIAWVVIGTIRLVGLEAGVLLGALALFVQQPVSGAAFPASFASDWVRWAEPIAPLRYLVEGTRNLLIGGSTTPDMALALALIGVTGLGLAVAGMARLSLTGQRATSTSVQAA